MQAQSEPFVGPKRSKRNAPLISLSVISAVNWPDSASAMTMTAWVEILMHHHRVFGPGERGIFLPVDTQEPVIVTASNAD